MPISLSRRFGLHVRRMRQARELTQEQLAERADLSVDAIRRMEYGTFSPSLATLAKLAHGLGVSLHTLFEGLEAVRRDDVAELADFLAARTEREVQLACRVVRALFDEPQGEPSRERRS